MKKRYVFMMCVIAVVLLSICVLVACDPGNQKDKTEADYEWIEIATADELVGMKSDACYKLTADLNLNGAQWQPHSVIGFDGGGHTIKNATIIGNGAFLNSCNWLKNCTFDNFKTVCGGDLDKMAVACLSAKNSVENMRGRMEKDNETNERYAGGLVAETGSGATYMSSYAFGNSISDPDGANLQERESYQAGFIAIGKNALIMNCAAAGTKFSPEPSQAKRDEFSTTVFSKDYLDTSINYIYPDEDIYDIRNVNKCTIVTKLSDFYDPAKMKEMLALTDSRWVFKENSLPVFNF